MENKDLYFVAVKIFMLNDDNKLLITKDIFNDGWDIPGGRLREVDFEVSLADVIERKMLEELGSGVNYEIGTPVVFMRHEREELLQFGKKEKRRIFAVGYEAKYLGGEIFLGKNHEKYEWVDLKNFNAEKYFTGGWLKGVKEFQTYHNNKE
jgi:ADP-ribose pyrophosphatase YjhB (NUDIX family)